MERDHGAPAEGAASFHTTRWTVVMRAAHSQAQGGQSALAQLCRNDWYTLYVLARRRRGHFPDDAQDLTQGFFLHLLEQRALAGVDRLKGKLRSFLLASFQNHLSDQADPTRRLKRGGDKEFVGLDAALLLEEVGRTVSDPAEIDEEIHSLCEALNAAEGRLGP